MKINNSIDLQKSGLFFRSALSELSSLILSHFKSVNILFLLLTFLLSASELYATANITTPPTNVTASVASSSSVTVSFTRPTVTGSGTVTYTATSTPGNKTGTTTSGLSGGTGTITVTGLTAGTAYTFTVKAVADGSGDFTSTASNNITPRTITTYTFNATTNNNWGTSTNWSPNGVPSASDVVVIASNKTAIIPALTTALASRKKEPSAHLK